MARLLTTFTTIFDDKYCVSLPLWNNNNFHVQQWENEFWNMIQSIQSISSSLLISVWFCVTIYLLVLLIRSLLVGSIHLFICDTLLCFGIVLSFFLVISNLLSNPCYLFRYSYIFSTCILIINIFRIYPDHGLFWINMFGASDPCYLFHYSYIFSTCTLYSDHEYI